MIGAACFAVMMCEVSDCRKIAPAFLRSACQKLPYCLIHRVFASDAVDEDVESTAPSKP
jgi:hypothetical protein